MKNTPVDAKKQEAKREAARIRKQKSRQNLKANDKVRLHVSIGYKDKEVLTAMAEDKDISVNDLIVSLVRAHIQGNGIFRCPDEAGCLWESTEADIDLTVPVDVAAALQRYGNLLTAGEIIEILLGIELDPEWSEEEPNLQGGDELYYKMMTPAEAHWRRGDRRWQRAMAMGLGKDDTWRDRIPSRMRSTESKTLAWGRAIAAFKADPTNFKLLRVTRHEVKAWSEIKSYPLSWVDQKDVLPDLEQVFPVETVKEVSAVDYMDTWVQE